MSEFEQPQTPDSLLPWYVNQSLSIAEQSSVENWLSEHPQTTEQLAAWQQIHTAAVSQPKAALSPRVKRDLMARVQAIRRARVKRVRIGWLVGSAIAVVMLLALWAVVQPGIALQWSVTGSGAQSYRIYRAVTGTSEYALLQEIPARPDTPHYTFTDVTSLPGQSYTYLVEAVTLNGQSILSRTATGNGLDLLPALLSLVLTSILAGYAGMYLVDNQVNFIGARRTTSA